MLTVHHLGISQSERIVWLCEELGLTYELKRYDRRADNRLAPDEYKKLHPMGIAPVITDGDLVLGEGSTFVPPDGGSLAAYLDSLHRVQELDLELLCPGHGPWVTDPAAKVSEYIDHRLDRERKLVAALDAGERSRSRLLDAAWDDVPEELRPAAALVMQAHLEKLDAEGRLPGDIHD